MVNDQDFPKLTGGLDKGGQDKGGLDNVEYGNKFWSRNDPILLADFSNEEAPKDAFKVHFKIENKKNNISEKPNNEKWIKVNHDVK